MSLKISYDELRREIGRHLGYGRDPASWSADQIQDVSDILRGGSRLFYWPTLPEGAQRWSFLCQTRSISLAANVNVFELPADFVRLCGDITYSVNAKGGKLRQIGESEYRALVDRSSLSGRPAYYTVRQRDDDEGYELLFYPVPGDAVSLMYRYEKAPAELDDSNEYHLGPASFSELLLAACLFTADKKMNKESLPADGGLYGGRYAQLLQAALQADKAMQVSAAMSM